MPSQQRRRAVDYRQYLADVVSKEFYPVDARENGEMQGLVVVDSILRVYSRKR